MAEIYVLGYGLVTFSWIRYDQFCKENGIKNVYPKPKSYGKIKH